MIYLDSAATTLRKPPSVARACAYAVDHLATPGRGGHRPAMAAAETAFACRREAAALFDVPEPDRVGLYLQRHPRPEHRHQNPGKAGEHRAHLRL